MVAVVETPLYDTVALAIGVPVAVVDTPRQETAALAMPALVAALAIVPAIAPLELPTVFRSCRGFRALQNCVVQPEKWR